MLDELFERHAGENADKQAPKESSHRWKKLHDLFDNGQRNKPQNSWSTPFSCGLKINFFGEMPHSSFAPFISSKRPVTCFKGVKNGPQELDLANFLKSDFQMSERESKDFESQMYEAGTRENRQLSKPSASKNSPVESFLRLTPAKHQKRLTKF